MKKILFLYIFLIIFSCFKEQNKPVNKKQFVIKKPSEYFPKEKAKILLVGTFHMNYPNYDAIKVPENEKIDVLKEPKKSEITELVEYLKKFKPTKIAVEKSTHWNKNILTNYKAGKFKNNRNECYQLGARIASEMNHDTIYAINSWSMYSYLKNLDSAYISNLFKDYDYSSNDIYASSINDWYKTEINIISKTNLLEYFKHINSYENHKYGFGIYLTGDFKLDNKRGADALSVNWMNRNLRVLRNIQNISEENDRVLIIIGNGHAAILRQFIDTSPEFEFVEFDSL